MAGAAWCRCAPMPYPSGTRSGSWCPANSPIEATLWTHEQAACRSRPSPPRTCRQRYGGRGGLTTERRELRQVVADRGCGDAPFAHGAARPVEALHYVAGSEHPGHVGSLVGVDDQATVGGGHRACVGCKI